VRVEFTAGVHDPSDETNLFYFSSSTTAITMPEGNFTCVYLTSVVSHSYEPLVQSRVSETESPLALLRGPNSRILDGLTSSSQLVEPQP
jgi:hypothetical protein